MPKPKKSVGDDVQIVTMRLDKDTATYYRRRANERGMSLSEFLRNAIVQGLIAERVQDIEDRMRALIAETRRDSGRAPAAQIPDALLLSAFTSEALLTAIVEARDVKQLYTAQDRAKARLARLISA